MKAFSTAFTLASGILLTACGGVDVQDAESVASVQLASNTVVSFDGGTLPAASLDRDTTVEIAQVATEARSALDGKWECISGDGHAVAMEFDISGTVLRHTASNTSMTLVQGKGIKVGAELVTYRDPETGHEMHAPAMTQVTKPGYASIFSSASHGGAGAGVEFSLNANDTIAINDFSSMAGAGSVGRPVPMTCRRVRT